MCHTWARIFNRRSEMSTIESKLLAFEKKLYCVLQCAVVNLFCNSGSTETCNCATTSCCKARSGDYNPVDQWSVNGYQSC